MNVQCEPQCNGKHDDITWPTPKYKEKVIQQVHGYNGGMKETSLNKRKKRKRKVYRIMTKACIGWQRKQEQRWCADDKNLSTNPGIYSFIAPWVTSVTLVCYWDIASWPFWHPDIDHFSVMGVEDRHSRFPWPLHVWVSVRRIFYCISNSGPVEIYDLQVGMGWIRIWSWLDYAWFSIRSDLDQNQQVIGSHVTMNIVFFAKYINNVAKSCFDACLRVWGNFWKPSFQVKKRYPALGMIRRWGKVFHQMMLFNDWFQGEASAMHVEGKEILGSHVLRFQVLVDLLAIRFENTSGVYYFQGQQPLQVFFWNRGLSTLIIIAYIYNPWMQHVHNHNHGI